MKSISSQLSAYPKSSYLLLLKPDESVSEEIAYLKNMFQDKYRFDEAMITQCHLTLLRFEQYELLENSIVQQIQKFSAGLSPFDIDLSGFGGFPSHTIYVDVKNKEPVIRLVKDLRRQIQRLLKSDGETKASFIVKPHITIARKLLPSHFERAWNDWQKKKFNACFKASDMLLLKKQRPEERWQELKNFPFNGHTAVQFTQGVLF